ncbi:MAG: recombinase family protein [Bacteroidota bacterium]
METNVVLYIRVSTDEQRDKGFSLQAQERKLREFCEQRGWNVLEVFSEDFSAWKGFDRPAYRQMKDYLIKNSKNLSYLLFTQWSRFSRDARESHVEIQSLKKLKIEANAIEQWVDSSIPENKYMLAFYLAAPEVENDRLSLRTKAGMQQAVRQGRWLWKAPFGYSNDTTTKLIVPNSETKETLQYIFSTFASGAYSFEEVRRFAKDKGCHLSKQAFINMLANPLYTGLIPERDERGKVIELHRGVHEPLISEETFSHVQAVMSGKRKPYQGKTKGNYLPLKGNLICPDCGGIMTGSASKGNGGHYHYYHCQAKSKCRNRYRASTANEAFEKYLRKFQVGKDELYLYHHILNDVFKVSDVEREQERKSLETAIDNIKDQIKKLDEKLMSDDLPMDRYNRLSAALEAKQNDLITQHATLGKSGSEYGSYLKYACSLMGDISGYYSRASHSTKQKLIGSIFPEKLVFDGKDYRTGKVNEVFAQIPNISKGYKQKQSNNNVELSCWAPPSGLEPETL